MGDVAQVKRGSAGHRTAARWGRATTVVLGAGLAVGLTACAQPGGATFTPRPVQTISASAAPATSATPTPSATSATPTPTPTPTPTAKAVKATGSMAIFMEVSDALAGTCATKGSAPTITLADHSNEWYQTVDATVVLDANRKKVAGVDVAFGEDSEGFHWQLSYSAAKPARGTSAKLTASGTDWKVTGKLTAKQTRKGKSRTEVLPFTITARCAAAEW